MELLSEISAQFPIRIISNMLDLPGLPRSDEPLFVGWYQDLITGLSPKAKSVARGPTIGLEAFVVATHH